LSRSKRLRSLLLPTSLLRPARLNDCAQHSHLPAAIRAIFIASLICFTVRHSKTENRGMLPEMSNFYCPPCRAEESPTWNGPNAPGMEWSANGATSLLSIDKSAPMPVKRRPEALIASVDGSFRVASETEAPAARRLAPIIPPSAPGPIISVFKRFPGPHSLTHA
jgi:hypothetical protein